LLPAPKELLSDLKYVETDSVNFKKINSDIKFNLNLINPDLDNLIFSDNSLEYLLEVDQYTEETIKVPVNVLFNSDYSKFNYYPKELSVKYNISINDYIEVNPMDFKIECVYDSNSPNNISKAEISKKPSFVKNVRLNTDQIQIIIL